MPGFKAFDVYGELHLDKDELRKAVRGLPGEMGGDVDRAGQDLGKKLTEGLAKAVEASSARLAKARRAEGAAADAVKLAELRLTEAREKGNQKASVLLALEQKLTQSKLRLADASSATTKATNNLAAAQQKLAQGIADVGKAAGPAATKAGEDVGGKLSQGIEMSIVRNSPLILAAVTGAMTVGAPAIMAGAVGLFSGIGVVAAAQSDRVQSAWLGTWQAVRDGAIKDAQVIEPVLVGLADRVGDGFTRMRPRLQNIFANTAPQIEVFTDGLLGLAENALPGFDRALIRSMPVTQGFAAFLEKTGTGLTGFLDNISSHAPAAGQAFSRLGDTMGTLLPLFGELLGQGAEIATLVLPALNGALGMTLSVTKALGPALPWVVAGLGAMKMAQSAAGWIGGLAEKINALDTGSGRVRGALDRVSAAMTPVNVVTGVLTVATGLLMAAHEQSEARIRDWTAALNQGGAAARAAREEMAQHDAKIREATSGFTGFILSQTLAGAAIADAAGDVRDAKQAHDDYLASLSPLEEAQRKVGIAQEIMERAVARYGPTSDQATAATDAYKRAQAEAEREASNLALAIHGVTDAMVAQTEQAMAAIDSGFAYEKSINTMEDAQAALNEAIKEFGPNSEEASRAQLALSEDTYGVAAAFGRQQADLSGLEQGTAEYTRYLQENTLKRLYELHAAAGPETKAAIGQQIAALEASGISMSNLGSLAVDATGKVQYLGAQRPTPVATLVDNASRSAQWIASSIDRIPLSKTSSAGLIDRASGSAQWIASSIDRIPLYRTSTITTNHISNYISNYSSNQVAFRRAGGASGGQIGDIAARRFAMGGSPSRRADGKLIGPGGPLDDLIPAVTDMGEQIRVANTEWLVRGFIAQQQGDAKMAALNAGRADIVVRRPAPRGFRDGGAPAPAALAAAETRGTTLTVGRMDVHLHGFDIRQRGEARRFVDWIEEELVKKARARSGTAA